MRLHIRSTCPDTHRLMGIPLIICLCDEWHSQWDYHHLLPLAPEWTTRLSKSNKNNQLKNKTQASCWRLICQTNTHTHTQDFQLAMWYWWFYLVVHCCGCGHSFVSGALSYYKSRKHTHNCSCLFIKYIRYTLVHGSPWPPNLITLWIAILTLSTPWLQAPI